MMKPTFENIGKINDLKAVIEALDEAISFFELFSEESDRQTQMVEAHEKAVWLLQDEFEIDDEPTYTEDTKRRLKNGDGAYYIEGAGEYYDSWIQMIKECFRCEMSKEEIREACDLDNGGYLYYTEFYVEPNFIYIKSVD